MYGKTSMTCFKYVSGVPVWFQSPAPHPPVWQQNLHPFDREL